MLCIRETRKFFIIFCVKARRDDIIMERGKSSAVVVVVPRHIEVETQYVCIGSSISNDNVFEKVHTNTTWRPCFLLKYFFGSPNDHVCAVHGVDPGPGGPLAALLLGQGHRAALPLLELSQTFFYFHFLGKIPHLPSSRIQPRPPPHPRPHLQPRPQPHLQPRPLFGIWGTVSIISVKLCCCLFLLTYQPLPLRRSLLPRPPPQPLPQPPLLKFRKRNIISLLVD